MARERGLDAVVMNLGGGFQDFLAWRAALDYRDCEEWIIGRPAVHPMRNLCDYFQAADVVVQSSLAEGGGISPLEALACGTPVVATRVGGMAVQLKGFAQLMPRGDATAMADAFRWVAGILKPRGSRRCAAATTSMRRGRADRAFAAICRPRLKESCGRPS